VRRTERKWKSLSKQEREAFLSHAHENHVAAEHTKEHMRDMRKEIIEKNKALVQQERERKVQDAMRIVEKKEEREAANRSLRDAMYTSRYADANKTAVMSQPLEEAAAAAGLAEVVPVPSPYRLS
jgi:capsular polysaccharide biosynthesis protein